MAQHKTFLYIPSPVAVRRDLVANRRWIFGCLVIIGVLVLISTSCFHYAEKGYQVNGKTHDEWFDSFYFTIINITTVGFGDITPESTFGKIIAMFNSVLGVVIFGLLVAILTMALQPGEFTATATGGAVNPISPSEPEIPAKQQNTEEQRTEEAVGLILKGLGSLVGGDNVKEGHVRIRVHGKNGPDNTIHMYVDIFVDVG